MCSPKEALLFVKNNSECHRPFKYINIHKILISYLPIIVINSAQDITKVRKPIHILDGNSEIGAHVRSNLCYLICLRRLIRSRAVTNRLFLLRKDLLFFMRSQHNLSDPVYKYHDIYSKPFATYIMIGY